MPRDPDSPPVGPSEALYSVDATGQKVDAWIWAELLGDDDHDEGEYRHVLGSRDLKDWDESEHPRADDGKFTDDGGGEARPRERETFLHSPKDAVNSLLNGEKVNIDRGDILAFLQEAGKTHEDPDLTDVHVDGMLIFGGNGLGVSRADMPQIPKALRSDYLRELKKQGVKVTEESVSPLSLAPTQKEVSARDVWEKLEQYRKDPHRKFPPLLVSNDGHVLDGHHHWGMMAALAAHNRTIKVPILRVHQPPAAALDFMQAFDELHEVPHKPLIRTRRIAASAYRTKLVLLVGTTEGAIKGWETRRGAAPEPLKPGALKEAPSKYFHLDPKVVMVKIRHLRPKPISEGDLARYEHYAQEAAAGGIQRNPLVLAPGSYDILSGNKIAQVAIKHGWKKVPVHFQSPKKWKEEHTYQHELSYAEKVARLLRQWEEGLHPRDETGKFTESGGATTERGSDAPAATTGRGVTVHPATPEAHAAFRQKFEAAFKDSPYDAFVSHYTPEEMAAGHMVPLTANDGKTGLLVKDHGDGRIEATALFNTSDVKGAGIALLKEAIDKHGVNYVEAYGPYLPKIYGALGFQTDEQFKFDPSLAASNWNRAKFDDPDYHTMRLKRG